MKISISTLFVLIVLTIIAAVVSITGGLHAATWILVLSALKFIGISFFFMDLRKANAFWKILVCAFLVLFVSIILIIK